MKYLSKLHRTLCKQKKEHEQEIINYTIPQSWNTFGFSKGTLLRNHEMIVNPYEFYTFAIQSILTNRKEAMESTVPLKEKGKKGDWLKQRFLYFQDLRTLGSWDHDRDGELSYFNMYGLSDQGTFLKAIILMPLLARAGIDTLLLHTIYPLDQKRNLHDFSDPHAILSFREWNPYFADPMAAGISVVDQAKAFMEAAHAYGMKVILDFCPALAARNSSYIKEHPEWFYWIKKEYEPSYHAPHVEGLPTGCIPTENACKLLYQSEDTKAHIEAFTKDPKSIDEERFEDLLQAYTSEERLPAIEDSYHITTAMMISDQINAELPIAKEYTMLRFYEDRHAHCPKDKEAPYLLQDMVRMDMYPGKHPMTSLWDEIKDSLAMWSKVFEMDGFYFSKPYLLPEKLIKEMISTVRKLNPQAAILMEATDEEHAQIYKKRGCDVVTGASAYQLHDIWSYQYHTYAYSLLSTPYLQLAASELLDTPRITQYDGGESLAKLFLYMNLFLPNAVPAITSGQLCLEKQPQYLSMFADSSFLNGVDSEDPRYYKQALLDKYYYDYTRKDFHVVINQLEIFTRIRKEYLSAICDPKRCVPVWFDTPKDYGIGFTYILEDRALLVVCNTNVHEEVYLCVHTENMLWELPFERTSMRQIASSDDPYIHDIVLNEFQNIPLTFAPGEVKLIEIR